MRAGSFSDGSSLSWLAPSLDARRLGPLECAIDFGTAVIIARTLEDGNGKSL